MIILAVECSRRFSCLLITGCVAQFTVKELSFGVLRSWSMVNTAANSGKQLHIHRAHAVSMADALEDAYAAAPL